MMHQPSINDNYAPLHQQDGDSLSIMMKKECTTYACRDYLNQGDNSDCNESESLLCHDKDHKITRDDRMKIVDWCYDVVDQCQFDRESVAVAMNIADRFMSTQGAQCIMYNRGQYQLLIMTALYISIKIKERLSFSSKDFSAASHGAYSSEEIESMELTILHGLKWRLCCPTALQVGCHIFELMVPQVHGLNVRVESGTWDFLREELAFQTENAVRGYYFTTQRSSTVAVVAIMNAIERVNDADYELIVNALFCVLNEFEFDSPRVLLNTMHHLRCLVEENKERGVDVPETTRRPLNEPTLEQAHDACDMACRRIMAVSPNRTQDKLEGTTGNINKSLPKSLSPISDSVACTEQDDDSCTTVY